MNELEILNKHSINHKVIKVKTTKLVIKYDRKGILIIRCPLSLRNKEIEEFITKHLDWIIERYDKSQPVKRNYVDNGKYLFLGKEYDLQVSYNRHEDVVINDDKIFVYALNENRIPMVLNNWKKEQAEILFSEVLFKCFNEMKDELNLYPKLLIKKYLSRWGCCYPKRNQIILNIALIHVPLELITYVVYHELSHFKYMNHQQEFHMFLEKYCPKERQLRNQLKQYHTDYE